VALKDTNFRRLLLTFEALADMGPELTAERDFSQAAHSMLSALIEALGAREAALFTYNSKPSALAGMAAIGFTNVPRQPVIPLLPKQVHALTVLRGPQLLTAKSYDAYLTPNGNVAPQLFKVISALRVSGKLVGALVLGRREGDAQYADEELEALGLLSHYVALAVNNHMLAQSLESRISENLRLLASLHTFYDNALEVFATAIDVKHVHTHGHSLRVGRYSAGIGEALGLDPSDVSGLRAAGYLHDIGKVTVDKHIFGKPGALDPQEFREMADHTTVGHSIVSGVQFPWSNVPDVVRWHHERADGTGYPDRLQSSDVSMPVRIVAVADTFDAMTSARPYRHPLSLGDALNEIVRLTPQKFDSSVVQALLIAVRRDAVGKNRVKFLDEHLECNIAAPDVDHIAADLSYRVNSGRVYSA
jgi:putative nucleotidyltransferase with HDIG domain